MIDPETQSQDTRRLYFNLVTAQVVFVVKGEIQMITKQTFGANPESTMTARYLLQLQNTIATQIKSQVEAGGNRFDKILDVIILNIAPLGYMTHQEFWEGMDIPSETVPMTDLDQSADMTNVTPLRLNLDS